LLLHKLFADIFALPHYCQVLIKGELETATLTVSAKVAPAPVAAAPAPAEATADE